MNNMDKIPTVEEFAKYYKVDKDGNLQNQDKSSYDMMIEFAKLHVKEALKAAAKQATGVIDIEWNEAVIDKDSILNAYPDKLII